MKSVAKKYLSQYAEPEVKQLAGLLHAEKFAHSIIIPAYKESAAFVKRLLSGVLFTEALADKNSASVLVIVVVNQPQHDMNLTPQQNLWQDIVALAAQQFIISEELRLLSFADSSSKLLLVDRFHNPIPDKQGVGLARKIACDLALSLIEQGIVTSHFIASTDADAELPLNYFNIQTQLTTDCSAGVYQFRHYSSDNLIHQATQQYEAALRYYVNGLTYAGSPYNFFTIGSILVFDKDAYAKVRGFPKKAAGEDFYLLNKLAKIGKVQFLPEAEITLCARESDRVPFGTGPAVTHIIELIKQQQPYCYYHPNVFVVLKDLYQSLATLFAQPEKYPIWFAAQPEILQQTLVSIGIESFIDKHQHSTQAQFKKQWHVWFDAFKTLKFIHFLRDHFYPNLSWPEIIMNKPFE